VRENDCHQSLVIFSPKSQPYQAIVVELPPAAYKRYSLCAWRLHPNTRNQAKGMLENKCWTPLLGSRKCVGMFVIEIA